MDAPHTPRTSVIIRQWLIGIGGAWIVVWLIGPWIVNSILVRVHAPQLECITLREGDLIRWRSEGWATTKIGPHGLPGWNGLSPSNADQTRPRFVLWGDSQVEGFCVNDNDKLCNQLTRLAASKSWMIDCIPLGRSGTDASDWQSQIHRIDAWLQPRVHLFVITELSDLRCLEPYHDATSNAKRWQAESPEVVVWARRLRSEALVQAARNILLDSHTGELRSLRWSVGEAKSHPEDASASGAVSSNSSSFAQLARCLKEVESKLEGSLWIVYAPAVPRFGGSVLTTHPDDSAWDEIQTELAKQNLVTIDCRSAFIEAWQTHRQVARGFHQGQLSYGHLNAVGNRIICEAICDAMQEHDVVGSSTASELP